MNGNITTHTDFQSFIATLDGSGKQFEHFVKWFLKNDPEWSTLVEKVWMWDDWPDRWGPDCGIDHIVKTNFGETWAVQAKHYATDYYITKADVDTFLSESSRKVIDHRLLIATTDHIGPNAIRVIRGQEKPVTLHLADAFEKAQVAYPKSYDDLFKAKPKDKPTPHPYQETAIADVVAGFKNADRGQLIMACGTGKTYTTLWIKERLQANTTLVLLPSLNLLAPRCPASLVGATTYEPHLLANQRHLVERLVMADRTSKWFVRVNLQFGSIRHNGRRLIRGSLNVREVRVGALTNPQTHTAGCVAKFQVDPHGMRQSGSMRLRETGRRIC